jgi:hypothetical protein
LYPWQASTVIARNNSPRGAYIQSASLQGKPLERAWIIHAEIVRGRTLEFVVGPTPNKDWGSATAQLSHSPSPCLQANPWEGRPDGLLDEQASWRPDGILNRAVKPRSNDFNGGCRMHQHGASLRFAERVVPPPALQIAVDDHADELARAVDGRAAGDAANDDEQAFALSETFGRGHPDQLRVVIVGQLNPRTGTAARVLRVSFTRRLKLLPSLAPIRTEADKG